MKQAVVVDATYLAHRAFYATGSLMYEGQSTGVIFGILRDIKDFRDRFATDNLVFCFDHGPGLREQKYTFYKANRRGITYSEQELAARQNLRKQIQQLKTRILKDIGFTNVLFSDGYEADDVIASVVDNNKWLKHTIVTADEDLFQLIRERVCIFNPRSKKITDHKVFVKEYGVEPSDWAKVKAIAGCKSDNIPGVYLVGEKTAIKYLRGELKVDSPAYVAIEENKEVWEENLNLTTIPYPKCPKFVLKPQDEIRERDWREVLDRFGMKSIGVSDGE